VLFTTIAQLWAKVNQYSTFALFWTLEKRQVSLPLCLIAIAPKEPSVAHFLAQPVPQSENPTGNIFVMTDESHKDAYHQTL
jgi:hypothetical protein